MSLKIHGSPDNSNVYVRADITGWLDNSEQRDLISWFWKNRQDLVQEIACKDCQATKVL